ncbi:MAG: tetratricopeptide repeat protein, partial [Candidatus Omnitrophica bacterium]|nr:tetratricopeptide repeat protein [Candidatus Omnitrophota bacterium]
MDKIKVLATLTILFLAAAINVHAAGTSSSSWSSMDSQKSSAVSLYDRGVEATNGGNFNGALSYFQQALAEDKDNPDILNMIAHTQLKLGQIDESLETYKKALELRPRFPEAREYLGEAYIKAALREIKTLKG